MRARERKRQMGRHAEARELVSEGPALGSGSGGAERSSTKEMFPS